jgi:energy-coupling factor transporter ATP-binding protein EcfA2
VRIDQVWLTDFRGYESADVTFAPGLTVVTGPNGHGKTNLLEAVGYLATLESFRGSPTDALIRAGAERAVVRGAGVRDGRELLMEAELVAGVRKAGAKQRSSLFATLLAAFKTLVFRLTAQEDLVIGIPAAGQASEGHAELVGRRRGAEVERRGDIDDARAEADHVDGAVVHRGVERGLRLCARADAEVRGVREGRQCDQQCPAGHRRDGAKRSVQALHRRDSRVRRGSRRSRDVPLLG